MLRVSTILTFILLIAPSACTKSSEDSSGGAAVIEQTDGWIKFQLTAGAEQTISSNQGTTNGTSVLIPSGVLVDSVELLLQEGPSLADDYIHTSLDLEESIVVNSVGPAIDLKPSKNTLLNGEISVTIPKGDIPASESNLMILYKGIGAEGAWRLAALGQAYLADNGQTASFKISSFGRFQVIALSEGVNNNLDAVSPGAGPWYGVELDLYSQFAEPAVDGPDHFFLLFDKNGSILSAKSNDVRIIPPPSFDFNDLLVEGYTNIFDGSSEVQVGLALFNEDFDNGIWIDFRTNSDLQLVVRKLQRTVQEQLPTEPLDPSILEGQYFGVAATSKAAGAVSQLDKVFLNDKLELSYTDGKVSLVGSIREQELSGGELSFSSGATAEALGFMSGDITIDGSPYKSFMVPSLDRKSFALIVCTQSDEGSCPAGDGTGTYDARSLFIAIFERF